MKKGFILYLFSFLFLLLFQNCTYFGNVTIVSNGQLQTNMNGNGGGYDGKLSFTLYYKDQTINSDKIVMYSGESVSIEIHDGVAPYKFNVIGKGNFNTEFQTYTTPYYALSPQFESIEVQDSAGAKGIISIQINSFIGQNKLIYPGPNSTTSNNQPTHISVTSKEVLFTIIQYNDYQFLTHSVLRQSLDKGETWATVHEFENLSAKVYINPYNDDLYVIGDSEFKIFRSTDLGATWTETKLSLLSHSQDYLNMNGVFFMSKNELFLYGQLSKLDTTTNKNTYSGSIFKSKDYGQTWNIVDLYTDPSLPNGQVNNNTQHIFKDHNGVLYAGANAPTSTSSSSIVVRKSLDNGTTWTTDFSYQYNSSHPHTSLNSMAIDELGNVFVCGTVMDDNIHQHWLLFKKQAQSSNWSLIWDYKYQQQASSCFLSIAPNNDIYIRGYGFNSTGGHELKFVSSNSGSTWNLIDDTPFSYTTGLNKTYDYYSLADPYIFLSDGTVIMSGNRTNKNSNSVLISKSFDFGKTWIVKNEFVGKAKLGGSFIANDFIQFDNTTFFLIGSGQNPKNNGSKLWLVLKSSDSGASWSVADQYLGVNNDYFFSNAISIYKDSRGYIFVTGQVKNSHQEPFYSIRRSKDQGITWETVDELGSPSESLLKVNNSAISITENKNGELFALGVIFNDKYYSTGKLISGTPTQQSVIRKSTDGGTSWSQIYTFGVYSFPKQIKSCFGDSLFAYSGDGPTYFDKFLRSTDNGLTWNSVKDESGQNILASNFIELSKIKCNQTDEISFFATTYVNYNFANPTNYYFQSFDKGITWTKKIVEFNNNPMLSKFAINDFDFDGSYFWLGGSVYSSDDNLNSVNSNWTVVRSSVDFKQSFIVDQFVDSKGTSEVNKILSTSKGICALGTTNDFKEKPSFSMFRFINLKGGL